VAFLSYLHITYQKYSFSLFFGLLFFGYASVLVRDVELELDVGRDVGRWMVGLAFAAAACRAHVLFFSRPALCLSLLSALCSRRLSSPTQLSPALSVASLNSVSVSSISVSQSVSAQSPSEALAQASACAKRKQSECG
jgi:hypothetical protein